MMSGINIYILELCFIPKNKTTKGNSLENAVFQKLETFTYTLDAK